MGKNFVIVISAKDLKGFIRISNFEHIGSFFKYLNLNISQQKEIFIWLYTLLLFVYRVQFSRYIHMYSTIQLSSVYFQSSPWRLLPHPAAWNTVLECINLCNLPCIEINVIYICILYIQIVYTDFHGIIQYIKKTLVMQQNDDTKKAKLKKTWSR